MAKPRRTKNKDNARRSKKKVSLLTQEKIEYVDYKDVNLLRRFMSDRAKIRARRVTGNDAQQQREIAQAIGVSLRSVSKEIHRWTKAGRIKRLAGHYIISPGDAVLVRKYPPTAPVARLTT